MMHEDVETPQKDFETTVRFRSWIAHDGGVASIYPSLKLCLAKGTNNKSALFYRHRIRQILRNTPCHLVHIMPAL